ncbi:Disease resistance protein RPP13 [Hordeum vulgare]|nr:Disease resistance protein RPP13 [Hordeum vulgare]
MCGPTVERVCGGTFGSRGSGDKRLDAGGAVASPLQHGRQGLAGPFRARLGQGWPCMPCCRVWSVATAVPEARASRMSAMEVDLLPFGFGVAAPSFDAAFRSPWPRVGVHNETAWNRASAWDQTMV